jgi:pyrroloquinoline quinone biosynthesis protein D
MGDPAARPGDDERPFLPRGVRLRFCNVRQAWFLLAPERAMRLDGPGAAVLGAVDGKRTFAEIVAKLAQDFAAPADRIATDARKFLGELINRRMLEAT